MGQGAKCKSVPTEHFSEGVIFRGVGGVKEEQQCMMKQPGEGATSTCCHFIPEETGEGVVTSP